MKVTKKIIRIVIVVVFSTLFCLSLVSCTNMKAVSNFSKLSQKSTEKFPSIAADIHNSCKRRAQYEKEAIDCLEFKNTETALLETHKMLVAYMSSLGTLADDKVVVYDKELDSFEKELIKTNKFDKNQVSAINSLGKIIFKAASSKYVNDKLKNIINDSNENFQTAILAIKDLVEKDYGRIINLEKNALNSYYNTLIKKYGDKEYIAVILAKEKLDEKLEFLKKREVAKDAFKKILENISQGHQDLFEGKEDLSSEELIKKMIQYGKELSKSIKSISDAF